MKAARASCKLRMVAASQRSAHRTLDAPHNCLYVLRILGLMSTAASTRMPSALAASEKPPSPHAKSSTML
eukprot:9722837-Prorocentrum_lima.AAC.1